MGLINLLRFLKGYVQFSCNGGFTERFINLCAMNHIIIWDISYSEKNFSAKVKTSDFFKLRKIARSSGVTLRIIKKNGLIFSYKKHNHRIGIVMSVLFYLLFVFSMNQFIWCIEISGEEKIPEQDLVSKVNETGLNIGTFKPFFDETKAANSLAKNSNGTIDWAAINIKGSKAVVEIRESTKSNAEISEETPSNIVADFDGVVLSVEVKSGIPFVKNGYAVKKGDLLISGVFENDDLSSSFIESEGKITASHKKSSGVLFRKDIIVKEIEDFKKEYYISFFSLKIPIKICGNKEAFNKYSDELHFTFNSIRLPLSLKTDTLIKTADKARSEKETFLSSCEKYSEITYLLNANTKVLSEDIKVINNKDYYAFNAEYSCIDFIGEEQIIRLEE